MNHNPISHRRFKILACVLYKNADFFQQLSVHFQNSSSENYAMEITKLCIFFVVAVTSVRTQTINVNCSFIGSGESYRCSLFRVVIPDIQNANFVIGGNHDKDRSDADVMRIEISESTIPFVIPQLFSTFSNVRTLRISRAGLLRIQSNAFSSARNLEEIIIDFNENFQTVEANAFTGSRNLRILRIYNNNIRKIHETAFAELDRLQNLQAHRNSIEELPARLFSSLTSLDFLSLEFNNLTSLDGQLFSNTNRLRVLNFSSNQINAIGRNFLDGLTSIEIIGMARNVCVDNGWVIGQTTIEDVARDLEPCFRNSAERPPNELRRFVLEFRGPLTLRYENGTEVVTL
jgi:hypothetical protein